MEAWLVKISTVAHQIALENGCELYDVESIGSGKSRILRIYIDKSSTVKTDNARANTIPESQDDLEIKSEAQMGIGIEDCSKVARALNVFLDAPENENLIPGSEYQLEVSSPGLDRHLKYKRHFEKVIGRKIFLQLDKNLGSFAVSDAPIEKAMENAKKFESELLAVEPALVDSSALQEDSLRNDTQAFVTLAIKNQKVRIPLSSVVKSKLVFEFKKNNERG